MNIIKKELSNRNSTTSPTHSAPLPSLKKIKKINQNRSFRVEKKEKYNTTATKSRTQQKASVQMKWLNASK